MRRLLVLLLVSSACATAPSTQTTLVVSQSGDPGALNPAITTSGSVHPVTDQIFNGLVGLDQDLNPVPELAERWSTEDEGRTYRFTLRQAVKWHDGVPFTAADVKFTFEHALLKYHSRTRAALEPLVIGIETPDDRTVVFRLKHRYHALLQRLDVVEASIIPKHKFEGLDVMKASGPPRPIGTGPFRFVSLAPGAQVVLERNPDYFRAGLPGVDRLVFQILPEPGTAIAALERGEIDYAGSVAGPEIQRLRDTPGIAVVAGTGGSGGSICQDVLIPNLMRAPFNDLRVRRAFAHALNRQALVDRVYFGQGRPATGPISHLLSWAYTSEVRQYAHDPAETRRLLDQAGFRAGKNGQRLAITFTHAPTQQRLATALRDQLSAVGITLDLRTLDFNAQADQVFVKKTFELGMASYCNGSDPEIGVRRVYVSSNIGPYPFSNGASYRNPRVDALFDAGAAAEHRDERRKAYVEIQQILADEIPYFWLIDSEGLRAYRTAFTGFRLWTGAFAETVRKAQ